MTAFIKEDNLNQFIRRDRRTVCGGQFLGGIQTERNVFNLPVVAYAICFVNLKTLDYVDFHTLTLVVKIRACFRHFDFLSRIYKLHGVDFLA